MPRDAAYDLTDAEKRDLIKLIEQGKPLPERYRFLLFDDKREVELVWNGKSREVCTAILPFQTLEHIDEPRKEVGRPLSRPAGTLSPAPSGGEGEGVAASSSLSPSDGERAGERGDSLVQADLLDLSGRQQKGWTNKLIWGDNKLILSSLKAGALRRQIEDAGGLKLIYIDPPFDVGADFSMDIEIGGETFHKEPNLLEQIAYRDTWGRGADSFIAMIYERLILMRDLMHSEGSIYVHCDWRVNSHIRLAMAEVFGGKNFRNEIIRIKCNPKNYTTSSFGNIHDSIFFFTKSEETKLNRIFDERDEEQSAADFPLIEEKTGRRYTTGALHAKGIRSGATGQPWRGIMPPSGRHWAYVPETLDKLDADGLIEWSSSGNPRGKRYADEDTGKVVQTIWEYKDPGDRSADYATQKPEGLLERIISASSNEGDLVADFFCGSGTTAAVAEKLGRKWIATDLGKFGIHTTRKRLIQVQRALKANGKPFRAFEVLNLGRYERQAYLNISTRLSAKKKAEALAKKEQEFRDLILRAYRAEPLGGGSFSGSAPAPGAVSRALAGNTEASEQNSAPGKSTAPEQSARARTAAAGAAALPNPTFPSDSFFHGKTSGRLVVVGPINLPVGRLFIEEVITECRKRGATRVDVLAFEFEMGLFPAVLDEAKQKGIDLAPKTIPPEVFDKRAVEKGQVRFHDLAYVEATPRFGLGSAPAPGAVSRALAGNTGASEQASASGKSAAPEQSARARTAAAGAAALPGNLTLAVELTDFSVYYSQGVADSIAAELKEGKSEVTCEQGKLIKLSKDKEGIITRDVLTKQWTDWVDYWAVDFDYESRKEIIKVEKGAGISGDKTELALLPENFEERWTGSYIFENEWQSFRTRQDRDLELKSASHTYEKPGRYIIAVKVIDIFGNDTMTLVPVTVG